MRQIRSMRCEKSFSQGSPSGNRAAFTLMALNRRRANLMSGSKTENQKHNTKHEKE
jgi:hypothetical protein